MKTRLCAIGLAVAVFAGAANAGASSTAHRLVAGSVQNFSAAVEAPTWTFTCDTKTTAWSFRIDGVQVMDSRAHPWKDIVNGIRGPWHVGMFAGLDGGPVPFNASATLHQNGTDGLFRGAANGTDPNIATWCQSGASLTAFAFSGGEQPLLLDATLS
jgi:hypothetical protein